METKIVDAEKKMSAISVSGDLDGSAAPKLLKEIEDLIEQGTKAVILDFTEIEFISSSGIGVIAVSSKDLSQRHGDLRVVCDNKKVLSLFDLTNLSKVVTVYKTLEAAIAAT